MKNPKVLIILSMIIQIILTGCVTNNPEKAKRKIARLVKSNPEIATFETDKVEVELPDLGFEFEADMQDKDMEEVVLEELLGFTKSEKKEVIQEVREIKKRGYTNKPIKVGKKTVTFKDKGDSIIGIESKGPSQKVKLDKTTITVQPPAEVKKKEFWSYGNILRAILAGAGVILLFWLWRKSKKEKE